MLYLLVCLLLLALPAFAREQDVVKLSRAWGKRFFSVPADATPLETAAATYGGGLPFSFVYDGRLSAEVVGQWQVETQTREPARNRQLRILTLVDPQTGLEVRAEATIYRDTGGVDWTVVFTNHGQQNTPILEQIQAVDVTVQPAGSAELVLRQLHGSTSAAEDWLPFDTPLPHGKRVEFEPHGPQANSSSGACPFFNLQWDGGGVITAIGWSAPWRASVERGQDNALHLRAGMAKSHLYLKPRESIRSPTPQPPARAGPTDSTATVSAASAALRAVAMVMSSSRNHRGGCGEHLMGEVCSAVRPALQHIGSRHPAPV